MTPQDYIVAARVPRSLEPQEFGLWRIERLSCGQRIVENRLVVMSEEAVGFPDYTLLSRLTEATLHQVRGDIVMEDSQRELRKHLPIWLNARGRVLVTGLGLGCVVRGLLANPDVDRIEVVEIDHGIARVIGPEFAGVRGVAGQSVELHIGDAREIDESWLPGRFDCAWHDLWTEGRDLQIQHAEMMFRLRRRCGPQGAWELPRFLKRMITRRGRIKLLGAARGGLIRRTSGSCSGTQNRDQRPP